MEFSGKKVLIVGLGKSGIAAAQVLAERGAVLTLYDKKAEVDPSVRQLFQAGNAEFCLGKSPDRPEEFDLLVMSPGVPLSLDFVEKAFAAGTEVIGELELAYLIGKGAYVAITGTNGKTTTTTLTGEIFKASGRRTEVVGNVGTAAVARAAEADDGTWMVTEASSFQLETIRRFHPLVSAVLNLTPDHLDRHKTMENYGAAKARVFLNQNKDDYFVVNKDDPGAWKLAADCPATVVPFSRKEELDFGCFVKAGRIVIAASQGSAGPQGGLLDVCGADELRIPGDHNLENALAACAISYFAGIEPQVIGRVLKAFPGVEHRMEPCGQVNGVCFVNDSKGTNPDASMKALSATRGGIVLIAGGYDKNSSFDEFIQAFDDKVKALVLLGKTAAQIKETAERHGFSNSIMVSSMEEAVSEAFKAAKPGDTVLLSPACASWDMYSCFEERGEHFKACVKNLEK